MPFGTGLEVGVRTYEDPLALIVEVRALGDFLKILQGVLFYPEQLPAWPVLGQFLSSSGLERSLINRGRCSLRRGQSPDEVTDEFQCTAVILIVLKQTGLDFCCLILVPSVAPDYALQPSSIFIVSCESKKPSDLFEAVRIGWEVDVGMDDGQDICRAFQNHIEFRMEGFGQGRFHSLQGVGFIPPKVQDSEVR